jgi:hypothetical protein
LQDWDIAMTGSTISGFNATTGTANQQVSGAESARPRQAASALQTPLSASPATKISTTSPRKSAPKPVNGAATQTPGAPGADQSTALPADPPSKRTQAKRIEAFAIDRLKQIGDVRSEVVAYTTRRASNNPADLEHPAAIATRKLAASIEQDWGAHFKASTTAGPSGGEKMRENNSHHAEQAAAHLVATRYLHNANRSVLLRWHMDAAQAHLLAIGKDTDTAPFTTIHPDPGTLSLDTLTPVPAKYSPTGDTMAAPVSPFETSRNVDKTQPEPTPLPTAAGSNPSLASTNPLIDNQSRQGSLIAQSNSATAGLPLDKEIENPPLPGPNDPPGHWQITNTDGLGISPLSPEAYANAHRAGRVRKAMFVPKTTAPDNLDPLPASGSGTVASQPGSSPIHQLGSLPVTSDAMPHGSRTPAQDFVENDGRRDSQPETVLRDTGRERDIGSRPVSPTGGRTGGITDQVAGSAVREGEKGLATSATTMWQMMWQQARASALQMEMTNVSAIIKMVVQASEAVFKTVKEMGRAAKDMSN